MSWTARISSQRRRHHPPVLAASLHVNSDGVSAEQFRAPMQSGVCAAFDEFCGLKGTLSAAGSG